MDIQCNNCQSYLNIREVVTRCTECKELLKPKTNNMTTKLLKELETALAETWNLSLDVLKGANNEHSYIRSCMSYWLYVNGCHVLEIADLFDISKGTVYDYIAKHTKELQAQRSVFFDLKIEL